MHIIHIDSQTLQPRTLTLEEASEVGKAGGVVWLDIYPHDVGWEKAVETHLGLVLDEQHIQDAHNPTHPPFYDDTEQYEMLVFQGLTHSTLQQGSFEVESSPIAFFIKDNILLSVHSTLKTDFHLLRNRWLRGMRVRPPISAAGVLCLLLNWLTDQYMGLRVPFAQQLEHWQKQLLDPESSFRNWEALLKAGSQLRRYRMAMIEPQEEALDEWLDETDLDLDPRIEVRLNDVLEHFSRVSRDAETLQNDLENLVQIYFSATNQRTNEVIRVLTIASVIFLPLNLLAGIYGMNFEHMPGLGSPYGFIWLLLGMVTIITVVLGFIHWKKWL